MATTVYFTSALCGFPGSSFSTQVNNQALFVGQRAPSTVATTITTATQAGGTWISVGFWYTKSLTPVTISSSISVNLRGLESNNQANASLGLRVWKGDITTSSLSSQLGQTAALAELGTTEGAITGSFTPTSTAFASGDFIAFEVGVTNATGLTMGGGRTVNFYYAGPTAAASGDSFVTFTDNLLLSDRLVMI